MVLTILVCTNLISALYQMIVIWKSSKMSILGPNYKNDDSVLKIMQIIYFGRRMSIFGQTIENIDLGQCCREYQLWAKITENFKFGSNLSILGQDYRRYRFSVKLVNICWFGVKIIDFSSKLSNLGQNGRYWVKTVENVGFVSSL